MEKSWNLKIEVFFLWCPQFGKKSEFRRLGRNTWEARHLFHDNIEILSKQFKRAHMTQQYSQAHSEVYHELVYTEDYDMLTMNALKSGKTKILLSNLSEFLENTWPEFQNQILPNF